MAEQRQELEQEVNLREYIDVIVKRKKLILAIFFVSVIAVAIINFTMPRSYEISMLIEPCVIGINDSGGPVFADSPLNIKARVDAGAFDLNVIKALGLDPQKNKIKLKISQPKDSTFLKIGLDEPENKKELGIKILNQFLSEMNNFYKSVIEFKKDNIDRQIAVIYNGIKNANNSIRLNEESLKIVEAREKDLTNELKETKANTEQLLIKRNTLLEKKVPTDDISSLLYTNTIQQNITYFNQLNNQLFAIKTQKETIAIAVKTLQNDINNAGMEVEKLKASKESIRNINLIVGPQAELISRSKTRNVTLVGILGLIFGAFLAFSMEFLERSKKA